jgi:hypothetical protein
VCARVGNQRSCGVVITRVRTDAVRSIRHQHQDLHQSTYPVPLRRLGHILLSPPLLVTRGRDLGLRSNVPGGFLLWISTAHLGPREALVLSAWHKGT